MATSEAADEPVSPKRALKHINSLTTPRDLLEYVGKRHADLDTINLATVLYRLARLYGFLQAEDEKAQWMAELTSSPRFKLLLRCLHSSLLDAQQLLQQRGETQGLNAWCVSNILWSLAKLDTLKGGHEVASLSAQIATATSPLVVHLLPGFSAQGLGNVLWSYAQISDAPVSVMVAVLNHVISLLGSDQAHMMDAHAVARTLWSVSHVRTTEHPADDVSEWQDAVTQDLPVSGNSGAEDRRPYQAMSTIAYSYSVLLGSGCAVQDPIRSLFDVIKQKLVHRLHMVLGSPTPARHGPNNALSTFNGHILSTLVKAYDTAQLLTPDLLQLVLDVAAVKISQNKPGAQGVKFFKSEDVCVLLKATTQVASNPLRLVQALSRILQRSRTACQTWSDQDIASISAAIGLVQAHMQQQRSAAGANLRLSPHTAPLPLGFQQPRSTMQLLPRTTSLDMGAPPPLVTNRAGGFRNHGSNLAAALGGPSPRATSRASFAWCYSPSLREGQPAAGPVVPDFVLPGAQVQQGHSGGVREVSSGPLLGGARTSMAQDNTLPAANSDVAALANLLSTLRAPNAPNACSIPGLPGRSSHTAVGQSAPGAPNGAWGQSMASLWGLETEVTSHGTPGSSSSVVSNLVSVQSGPFMSSDATSSVTGGPAADQYWLVDALGNAQPCMLLSTPSEETPGGPYMQQFQPM